VSLAIRFDKKRRMAKEAEEARLRDHMTAQSEKADWTGPFRTLGRLAEAVKNSHAERADLVAEKTRDATQEILAEIAVVAFIGPSGTGKSTRAIALARQYQIPYLIDDGLLIHGSRIVAGSSAKRASSRLESVRQALFADETRAAVMRRALVAHRPTTLMILGTSDGMLEKICRNLWLNQPAMLIRIEDVSTDEEMRQAKQTRLTEGKHTIPVPSMEIKHEFSGYFSAPISRLRRRWDRDRGAQSGFLDSERTVVRPTFSSLGSYSISDEALRMMVEIILRRIRGVADLVGFSAENEIAGVVIDLDLALVYGFNAQQVLHEVQEKVSAQIEEYTSINVMALNVKARRVEHAQAASHSNVMDESRS
jgi:uncharacterized alkaline shock family protein YloU